MLSVIFNSICLQYQETPVDDDENDTIDDNNKKVAAVIPNVKIKFRCSALSSKYHKTCYFPFQEIKTRNDGISRSSVFGAGAP